MSLKDIRAPGKLSEPLFPGTPVLRAVFRLSHAVQYPGPRHVSLGKLAHMRLAALAGLARPEVFCHSLQEIGIDLRHFFTFPDHHAFTAQDVAGVIAGAPGLGIEALATTEKDWLRLSGIWNFDIPLFVVHLQVTLLDPWPLDLMPPGCVQKLTTL